MKISMLFLLACVVFSSCHAQRINEWEADMDFWLQEVKKQHYVYRSTLLPPHFEQQFQKVKSSIADYSDQRLLIELLGLSAMLGDGHTYVLPWDAERVKTMTLPFRFYLFDDGLFVIDAHPGYEKWIGKQVVSLGAVPIDDVVKRIRRFISRDNDQGVKWIAPVMLPLEGMLQALEVDGNGKYTVTFRDGNELLKESFAVVPFKPVRGVPKLMPAKQLGTTTPLYLQHVDRPYWMKSLPDKKIIYVQFNQVMNDERESIKSFSARLMDSVKIIAPTKLVVDVRHNNGGTLELLPPLLETLQVFKSTPGSSVYIITGRNTFSAAQVFINRAEKMFEPIFVGEHSSSKPNFVGEENGILLPGSKAICSISNRYHETTPGDIRQEIKPHLPIPVLSADYFAGRDAALDAIVNR